VDHKPYTVLDCRIVQSGDAGPTPLVGDEMVVGHGVRRGKGLVDVSSLRIGEKGATRLRAARPKSASAVFLPSLALLCAAGAILYAERAVIMSFDPEYVLAQVAQALVILVVIGLLLKFSKSRLRL
jgi:hypothetical protein